MSEFSLFSLNSLNLFSFELFGNFFNNSFVLGLDLFKNDWVSSSYSFCALLVNNSLNCTWAPFLRNWLFGSSDNILSLSLTDNSINFISNHKLCDSLWSNCLHGYSFRLDILSFRIFSLDRFNNILKMCIFLNYSLVNCFCNNYLANFSCIYLLGITLG